MGNRVVSIVIPVYNVEKYIEKCLVSIMNQTYPHLQIIVVNDGSTDRSEAVVSLLAEKDSRISIIRKENGGQSSARNEGMRNAVGEYLMFVDGDDYIESTMVERMVEEMIRTDADIIECGYNQVFINNCPPETIPFLKNYGTIVGIEQIMENQLNGNVSLLVWNKLYRTKAVYDIKYVESVRYEDILWSAEVLLKTTKICSIPAPLYYWVQRSGSTTNSRTDKRRLMAVENFDKRIEMLAQYPRLHLLARARIVCECYLECSAFVSLGDTALVQLGRKHSAYYYKKHKLTVAEVIHLKQPREMIRYGYYLLKYIFVNLLSFLKS